MSNKREGVVRTYQHHNNRLAVLVEVATETDFVARNDEFLEFVDNITLHIASENPASHNELMEQKWLFDDSKTVQELMVETRKKFGEKIRLDSYVRWTLDPEPVTNNEAVDSDKV